LDHTIGDFDHAIREYDIVIRFKYKGQVAFYGRGEVYYAKGDLDRALHDFDQAIQLDPKDVKSYRILLLCIIKKATWSQPSVFSAD
jgi:tetratricopeptide (TPR) repeat protein